MKKLTALVLVSLLLLSTFSTVFATAPSVKLEKFADAMVNTCLTMFGDPADIEEFEGSDSLLLIGYLSANSDLPSGQGAIFITWGGYLMTWVESTFDVMATILAIQELLDTYTITHGFVQIVDLAKII